ncbi:hypothetical protein FACS1894166_12650 [Bacilli bacterium]|nr:hypothetical protein FACS1894166_12650 [Bacilli bacterium]
MDKNNIKIAKRIQHLLFPEDNGDYYFEQSLDLTNKYFKNINYWLIKHNNEFVGIIGLYVYKEYPEDA